MMRTDHSSLFLSFAGLLAAGGMFSSAYHPNVTNSQFDEIRMMSAVYGVLFTLAICLSLYKICLQSRSRSLASKIRATSTALERVDLALNFLELFLPARIMKEVAGDAREVIAKLVGNNAPTWMIYTKLTSSVFWILLAAAREVLTVTKRKPN